MYALTQVIVQSTGEISGGSAATPNLALDNLIAIFDLSPPAAAGEIDIGTSTPVLADYTVIQIVRGVATGQIPILSTELQVSRIKRVLKKAYRAPAGQVTTLTVLPAVPAEGGTYRFGVAHTAKQTETPHRLHTYEKTYAAGQSLVVADLLAAINDDPDAIVTATTGGANVILTGDFVGEPFDFFADELMIGVVETLTTPADKGNGTPAQILELEKNTKGTVAEYYVNDQILGPRPGDSFTFPPRTFSEAGKTYATYTIEYENNFDESINRSFGSSEIILAIDSSATNEAELELFFDAVLITV